MGWLLLLFVAVPAAELALLIEIGSRIGTGATLALILGTGGLGASLARRQGLGVIRDLQRDTAAGQLPAGALVDGALILVAAAFLVTPGVLTDAAGFALLVPAVRSAIKRAALCRLERAAAEGRVRVQVFDSRADEWGPREEKVVHDLEDPSRHPSPPASR